MKAVVRVDKLRSDLTFLKRANRSVSLTNAVLPPV